METYSGKLSETELYETGILNNVRVYRDCPK